MKRWGWILLALVATILMSQLPASPAPGDRVAYPTRPMHDRLSSSVHGKFSTSMILATYSTNGRMSKEDKRKADDGINVFDYGAVDDARFYFDGAMTSGAGTLTSATANFKPSDTGKMILVHGAGTNGLLLQATITYVNTTTITLSANAGTTVSNTEFCYGTDNSAAFNAAFDNLDFMEYPEGNNRLYGGHPDKVVVIPQGAFLLGSSITVDDASDFEVRGGGTVIFGDIIAFNHNNVARATYNDITFEGMQYQSLIYGPTNSIALWFDGTANASKQNNVHDCRFRRVRVGVWADFQSGVKTQVYDNFFQTFDVLDSVAIYVGTTDNHIINNRATGFQTGLWLAYATNLVVGNHFWDKGIGTVTGDTTLGSPTITNLTVTSEGTSMMKVGGYVKVSAGFAAGYHKIISVVTDTSVTLDANATSTETGAIARTAAQLNGIVIEWGGATITANEMDNCELGNIKLMNVDERPVVITQNQFLRTKFSQPIISFEPSVAGLGITNVTITDNGWHDVTTAGDIVYYSPDVDQSLNENYIFRDNIHPDAYTVTDPNAKIGVMEDIINKNVAIGTATPDPLTNGLYIHRPSTVAGTSTVLLDQYGGSPSIVARRANGTTGVPTQVLSGNTTFTYSSRPWLSDTSAFAATGAASVRFVATENITSTTRGHKLAFDTTANGTSTLSEAMSLDGDKKLTVVGQVITPSVMFSGDSTTQTTAAKFSSPTNITGYVQLSSGVGGGFTHNNLLYYTGGKLTLEDMQFTTANPTIFTDDYTTTGAATAPSSTAFVGLSNRIPPITASTVPRMNSGATAYEASQIISNATGVGIGAAVVAGALEVNGATAPLSSIRAYRTDATSSTGGASFHLYSNDGAAMASGDRLAFINMGGARNATNTIQVGARIDGYADGAWSDTSTPGRMAFFTTPSSTVTPSEKVSIASDGLITMSNGGGVPFGSMYTDTALTITVSSAGVWYEVNTGATDFTAGLLKNVTQSDHYMVATTAGYYEVEACASLGTGVAGHKVALTTAVNGTATSYGHGHTTIANAASTSQVCILNILNLTAGQEVSLMVQNHSGGVNIDIDHAQAKMKYIGSP